MSKYGAKKTLRDGIVFDSKAEADCWTLLRLKYRNTGIRIERNRQNVKLVPGKPGISMRPDFVAKYANDQVAEYLEYKGAETAVYKIKKKLWAAFGPAPLRVWKTEGKTITETETIWPQPQREGV
jgi:hypothetical protein